ncbi:MAG TPA: ABC transporter permease [Bryobacteraceae bacterium]|nr:ABC transporter permease [Bryobacteraceae bacterium]
MSLSDLRLALRMLRRSPLFSVIAILALGVGIGANTAIFSLMDAVLLRPMPGIARPSELVSFERWQAGQLLGTMGYPDYQDYAQQLRGFSGVVAEASTRLSFAQGAHVERVAGALVSDNYFSVLGIQPVAGRLLVEDDDRETPAVLSFSFWQRAFGAAPGIVGNAITLNGHTFTIVGVAERSFRGTTLQFQPDLWLPIAQQPVAIPQLSRGALQNRSFGWLRIFGRLKPETSLTAAQAEVNQVAAQLTAEYPITNHRRTVALVEGVGLWSDERSELRRFLVLLLVSVALLQLLACANVANLQVVRSAARQREIGIRLALGATGVRLVRLFVAEAALLTAFAGIVGIVLARALTQLAVSVPQPAYALRETTVQLDWRVLTFAVMLGTVSGLLVACVPAWQAARVDLLTPLREGSPGAGRSKSRLRGALIAAQIAFSMVLLAAAGAALRTMERGLAANPIAHAENVMLCSLDLATQGYSAERGGRFYATLLDRVRDLPGVAAVSLAGTVPPEEISGRMPIFYPGQEPAAEILEGRAFELGLWVDNDSIGPGFFHTLGIPLLQGREFGQQDRADSVPVAVINSRLANRLWPGKDPIGQKIALGRPRQPATVVGVVKDVASRSLVGEPPMHLYFPYSQAYNGRAKIVVRGTVPQSELATSLRAAIAQMDPLLPLYAFQTMPEHIADTLWRQRIAAGLLGALGLLAIALASMGLYGVVAHNVSQRTREMGIRMAIGARGAQVCTLVMKQSLMWVVGGAAFGLPLALLATWTMQKGIPGTRSNDPLALVWTLSILGVVSIVASLIPAQRAAKVDPVVALRQE